MAGTSSTISECDADAATEQNETTKQSTAGGDDTNNDTSSKHDASEAGVADEETAPESTSSDKKRPLEEKNEGTAPSEEEPMPTLPLKKARTAYFIFADEKREELKQLVRIFIAIGKYDLLHFKHSNYLFLLANHSTRVKELRPSLVPRVNSGLD